MTLRERLLKALEFDKTKATKAARMEMNRPSLGRRRGVNDSVADASYYGAKTERNRTASIDLALAEVVEALELAMNHPAEGHTYCVFCGVADKVDHHGCCEGDAALAKLDEALKGVEK